MNQIMNGFQYKVINSDCYKTNNINSDCYKINKSEYVSQFCGESINLRSDLMLANQIILMIFKLVNSINPCILFTKLQVDLLLL